LHNTVLDLEKASHGKAAGFSRRVQREMINLMDKQSVVKPLKPTTTPPAKPKKSLLPGSTPQLAASQTAL